MSYDLKIDRLINASPEVVFDAFVDPATQETLYDNEDEQAWNVESELDLRVGGRWIISFGKADGKPFRETNVFTEVERPRRIAFESNMFKGEYGGSFDSNVTVTFEEQDGKTLLTILQTGFESQEERDMIHDGWPEILTALEQVVSAPEEAGL